MISSMTGFSRADKQIETGILVCEIRSINHRYLEMNLHLSDSLRSFEMLIREQIRHLIKRGKVECTIRYQMNVEDNTEININVSLAKALCQAGEEIASFLARPSAINPVYILQFPGVIEKNEMDTEVLQPALLSLLTTTLQELVNNRVREGKELVQMFLNRIESMRQELNKVRDQLPRLMVDINEKLQKRFTEAKLTLDSTRLEQEMVLYSHKIDIAEEIDRIEMHLNEVCRILSQGGNVGRRLDFLMQELNREANTLGSKSLDPTITHAAVEIKVLIEQIREQVQNVE